MIKLEKILQKEMTRKQFMLAALSGLAGAMGISTFLGAFTKDTDTKSKNPGYGTQRYGP